MSRTLVESCSHYIYIRYSEGILTAGTFSSNVLVTKLDTILREVGKNKAKKTCFPYPSQVVSVPKPRPAIGAFSIHTIEN